MLAKIVNEINPNNKNFNELSSEEMLELLIKLNRILRRLDENEDVLEEDMAAGDMVSPTKKVQLKTLNYLVENLRNVSDKKMRGAMVYYTLLNLHMFSDGNGRTARFMYDLLSEELSENNMEYYFHKEIGQQKNDLENVKGIWDICEVNRIPDEILGKQLGLVPKEILDEFSWITVGHSNTSPKTEEIIPEAVSKELTPKELKDLNKILQDGYGVELCPSGLAMLHVSNKKGQLSRWIEKNREDLKEGIGIEGRLNFSIYRNPEMIKDWNSEDFRNLINIGNAVKYARMKCLIDVFAEPQKYINSDSGNTYAKDILEAQRIEEYDEMVL